MILANDLCQPSVEGRVGESTEEEVWHGAKELKKYISQIENWKSSVGMSQPKEKGHGVI